MTGSEHPDLSDYERKLLDGISEYGWKNISVFDPEGDDPSFSYSVGFTSTLGAPEFIVFGLNIELMHSMLWEVFEQIKGGKAAVDGDHWRNMLEGFDCVAKAVHPTNVVRKYVNSAIWHWRHAGNEGEPALFQLFWPGKLDGYFPWDPECSNYVRSMQPTLYLPAH